MITPFASIRATAGSLLSNSVTHATPSTSPSSSSGTGWSWTLEPTPNHEGAGGSNRTSTTPPVGPMTSEHDVRSRILSIPARSRPGRPMAGSGMPPFVIDPGKRRVIEGARGMALSLQRDGVSRRPSSEISSARCSRRPAGRSSGDCRDSAGERTSSACPFKGNEGERRTTTSVVPRRLATNVSGDPYSPIGRKADVDLRSAGPRFLDGPIHQQVVSSREPGRSQSNPASIMVHVDGRNSGFTVPTMKSIDGGKKISS